MHFRLLLTISLLIGMSTVLTSCSFSRGTLGDELKSENVAGLKEGISTRAEVVNALGAPDRILQITGREVFQYYRYDAKAGSLLLIIVNFSRFNIKSDDLYVRFNQEGIVENIVFGKRTDKMKFRFWPFGD